MATICVGAHGEYRACADDDPETSARARYRGRFAPSPTGPLHFGSLVAALASYCDARHRDGEWLLRIEDVDLPRTQPGAADAILRTLEHYGFEWDGEVAWQSQRTARYETALERLRVQGDVFPCTCSRRDLETSSSGAGGERVYPGTCRRRPPVAAPDRHRIAWRIAVDREPAATVLFVDRLQGRVGQDLPRDVGDFVVKRADGLFAYQLAVVIDDAEQGITDVVRGADLLSSTPRQIYLQRRLRLPTPSYLHVPVAVDANGDKLSKQTRAAPLPPDGLPVLLAAWSFLGQQPADPPPPSIREFWAHATDRWDRAQLPPVAMLPWVPRYN